MVRQAFRCSANECFMPYDEYPAFSQNSARGKTRSPIGVFSPSFPSQQNPMALFKRSSASLASCMLLLSSLSFFLFSSHSSWQQASRKPPKWATATFQVIYQLALQAKEHRITF